MNYQKNLVAIKSKESQHKENKDNDLFENENEIVENNEEVSSCINEERKIIQEQIEREIHQETNDKKNELIESNFKYDKDLEDKTSEIIAKEIAKMFEVKILIVC